MQPSKPVGTKGNLLKAAGLVGLMTLASRILGMIRDIVSAGRFGTSWQWDAFVYAFMMPNFLRRIVGEGALGSAFIPVYSQTLQTRGQQEAFRYSNILLTLLSTAILGLLLILEVIFQALLSAKMLPLRLAFTVDLLRILFPYLWFISLYAFGMGILHCHRHFFTPSLGPVILDIVWIAAVLWVPPFAAAMPEDQLRWLSLAIFFSGAVQLGVELPPLFKLGFRWKWIWEPFDEGIRKSWNLILPSIMSFAIVQINILVDMTLGMLVGPGANSSLWYGTRLMQFPLGTFAIAMGTALLPAVSQQTASGHLEEAKKTISFALRSVFLIILPSSAGLIALSTPIVQFLFERGEFDAVSTARTSAVLVAYSVGLFAYSAQKIISTGFYALHDTRTPVKAGIIALLSNIALNLILMQFMAEAGLALATSIAAILQLGVLLYDFRKKMPGFPFREVGVSFVRIFLASAAMAIACLLIYHAASRFWPSEDGSGKLIRVGLSIVVSILCYLGFCVLFRVRELTEAWKWIAANRKKTAASPEQGEEAL